MIDHNACMYTCSLIESLCRTAKRSHSDIIGVLGYENVERIYKYADVFHCEPIEKTTDDFIRLCHISDGTYDYVGKCKYRVPAVWEIGAVFKNIIVGIATPEDDPVKKIEEVMYSWIAEQISNYNSDLYYQSPEYLICCYKEGKILEW